MIPTRFILSLVSSIFLFTSTAFAGGYALQEQSAVGLQQAFAGSSAGFGDGSSVWYNAAAMTRLDGDMASFSGHLIIPRASFTNKGSSLSPALGSPPISGGSGGDGGETAFVPNVYVVKAVGDDLRLGLGVNVPFGLSTEYNDDWVGRYHGIKSELTTVNFNPAIGYKVNEWLAVGAGMSVMYLDAELTNAIDFGSIGFGALGPEAAGMLGLVPGASDGKVKVTGDDWGVGYQLGFMVTPMDGTIMGFQFRSKIDATLDGSANFTVPDEAAPLTAGGGFTNSTAEASVTLPETISMGVRQEVIEDTLFFNFEALWTRWSRFQELRVKFDSPQPDAVTPEGWDTSWRFAWGAEYHHDEDLELRGGIAWEETPISSAQSRTPRIPDEERIWLTLGGTYSPMENLDLGLSYAHIFVDDPKINNTNSTGATLTGEYDAHVDIVSFSATYRLG